METIKFYGAEWCPDCRRTKEFLTKNAIPFDYINVDVSLEASSIVEGINNGKRIIPTLVINDEPFSNPTNHDLAKKLGVNKQGRVIVYGADWCPDCRRLKRFLQDNEIHHQFIDIDEHPEVAELVESLNGGKRIIPTLLLDKVPYSNPSNDQLIVALGLDKPAEDRIYDVVIV